MLRKKTGSSILAYYNNATKKDSTKGHVKIKDLLLDEIKKIPEWSPDKSPGKDLCKNVYAYVKRRHKYIFNTNFLEKGEENDAKKTIREYLYQYLETSDSDFKITTDEDEMTADELSEEFGALVTIDECEVNDQILSNLTKTRNDSNIIDSISTNLSEIVEQLKKIGKELSIDSYLQPHITSLQRLNFLLDSAAPIVGNRKISCVSDKNLYKKMVKVTLDLWKDFGEKVPLSLTYPGIVDGKEYIIAVVNLTKGTPVHNIPAEYMGFPLLVNYGTIKPSNNIYREFQPLKPGISIGDAENNSACTLGALFRGDPEDHCAIVKYQKLNIDDSGRLIDYAFCEVDEHSEISSNKPCGAEITINSFQTILDSESDVVDVHKVGRETGHTEGIMLPILQSCVLSKLFNEDKLAHGLIVHGVNGKFGDHGDSGAPVYDQDGALWGIYEGTSEDNDEISCVIPIDIILGDVYENKGVIFKLVKDKIRNLRKVSG
ncbi:hypothetical protein RclHR1_00250011 [Rhizophagus clarus]|uniref:Peptidase S1 domain-containing protein n=1 Tax=Rhizophagus clarus TaxID=94130 RepID=A0A2Z6QYE2_9GLOM|nr:hypothetical protein RclHR1_00250011 [Rhizophagus clarus]